MEINDKTFFVLLFFGYLVCFAPLELFDLGRIGFFPDLREIKAFADKRVLLRLGKYICGMGI